MIAVTMVALLGVPYVKRGLQSDGAMGCGEYEPHNGSSWVYSWTLVPPWQRALCSTPPTRALEFVPMIWGEGELQSSRLTRADSVAALTAAKYVMTFNEPELAGQSNIAPTRAAELWPQIEGIAAQYSLEIVAPCVKDGTGGDDGGWYDQWLAACDTQHGRPCNFNYTCAHFYLYPEPCTLAWGCARSLTHFIDLFASKYKRPMWVTETACSPWAAATGGLTCDASVHLELMEQIVPTYEASANVFRYSWYQLYEDGNLPGNNLNENYYSRAGGVYCENRKWLGSGAHSGPTTLPLCAQAARADSECSTPIAIANEIHGDQNCYCGTDDCATTVAAWAGITQYTPIAGAAPGVPEMAAVADAAPGDAAARAAQAGAAPA